MMNKKGQVLVVFVLLLPLIVIFLGLVIDIGNSLVMKKKYENIVKDVIIYNYKEDEVVEETTNEEETTVDNNELEDPVPSDDVQVDDTEIEELVQKEVDLSLIEKNIKDSIEDYEEVNINIEEDILIVNVKAQYKSIFSKVFNIGLNVINVEVKYDIKNKKLVRE